MPNPVGVIYILTNPSFPEFVKIGYTDDMDRRLREFNRSECVPFAFRVYAIYEVDSRLTDTKVHAIIDKLNPNLRATDDLNGRPRFREFYAMSPEDAYSIFEAMAEIHNCKHRLRRIAPNPQEVADEQVAEAIKNERRERMAPFTFSLCNIPVGAELEFWSNQYEASGKKCVVTDEKHVKYDEKIYSLSALAQKLLEAPNNVAGPRYFKYQDEWLNDIRKRVEQSS